MPGSALGGLTCGAYGGAVESEKVSEGRDTTLARFQYTFYEEMATNLATFEIVRVFIMIFRYVAWSWPFATYRSWPFARRSRGAPNLDLATRCETPCEATREQTRCRPKYPPPVFFDPRR